MFGPPPKHRDYQGGDAGVSEPSLSNEDRVGRPKGGEVPVEEAPSPTSRSGPPIPYRADTTTRNLPKPPVRSAEAQVSSGIHSPSPSPRPKPPLPPRLPPRHSSHSSYADASEAPPPSSKVSSPAASAGESSSQGALSRLGSAGIRVPGLGIGEGSAGLNSWQSRHNSNGKSPNLTEVEARGSPVSKLPSNFSSLSMNPSSPTDVPAQGTSFAQKQAAFKTASAFRNDPASISLSDAKATAMTANNFRERHGAQVAAGWQMGSGLNQKYGITNQSSDNAHAGHNASLNADNGEPAAPDATALSSLGTTGRPPPPVPKKSFAEINPLATKPAVPWSSKPKS